MVEDGAAHQLQMIALELLSAAITDPNTGQRRLLVADYLAYCAAIRVCVDQEQVKNTHLQTHVVCLRSESKRKTNCSSNVKLFVFVYTKKEKNKLQKKEKPHKHHLALRTKSKYLEGRKVHKALFFSLSCHS